MLVAKNNRGFRALKRPVPPGMSRSIVLAVFSRLHFTVCRAQEKLHILSLNIQLKIFLKKYAIYKKHFIKISHDPSGFLVSLRLKASSLYLVY